jgi:hypothetical protein
MDDGSGTGRSAVDIWPVLPEQYVASQANITAVQKKGDRVWSYTALEQDSYSPKWLIDFPPTNYRIFGLINQQLGLTGILYWAADHWTKNPWADVSYSTDGLNYPGEGMLTYPGSYVGVSSIVPSIRLKWIRDGVEDYEYVQMLKDKGEGAWALNVIGAAAIDWMNWTKDPDTLQRVRATLASELNRIPISSGQ